MQAMISHQGTVPIHTRRLLLRPFMPGDEGAIFGNWANDPEVCRHLAWLPHENIQYTREMLDSWLRRYGSDSYYHWGISLEGQLIGAISIVRWHEQNEEAELGYCLGRAYWSQGIMTEALQAVMRFLFETVGFHRIVLKHAAENPASGRVMQKAGLTYEGLHIQAHKRPDGSFSDMAQYAAINGQWQAGRRTNG